MQVINPVFQSLTSFCVFLIWKHHISSNNDAAPMKIEVLLIIFFVQLQRNMFCLMYSFSVMLVVVMENVDFFK